MALHRPWLMMLGCAKDPQHILYLEMEAAKTLVLDPQDPIYCPWGDGGVVAPLEGIVEVKVTAFRPSAEPPPAPTEAPTTSA